MASILCYSRPDSEGLVLMRASGPEVIIISFILQQIVEE